MSTIRHENVYVVEQFTLLRNMWVSVCVEYGEVYLREIVEYVADSNKLFAITDKYFENIEISLFCLSSQT